MNVPGFRITGPPRTKKTSNRVVNIGPMCRTCGKRGGFPKVLPSEAYCEWEAAAVKQCLTIRPLLAAAGVALPITAPVSIEALIYRDRDQGDIAGYIQAIGDMLQEAGIIANDAQIEDWDGSRRLIDRACPRVEIYITIVGATPPQQGNLLE